MYNRAVKTSRICGKRRKSMEDKPNEKIKVQPLTPAPLLIVLASFDPSGEGVNHYDPEHPEQNKQILRRAVGNIKAAGLL